MLLLLFALDALPTQYVHGDVVRVRDFPAESAGITARLRINTPVSVLSRQGDWARVRMDQGLFVADPVVGYVHGSLLGEAPLEAQQLRAAAEAGDRSAATRLEALEPTRRSSVELAVCQRLDQGPNRALHLGRWTPGEPLGEQDWLSESQRTPGPLGAMGWQLLDAVEGPAAPISGTPFPRPYLSYVYNEGPSTALRPSPQIPAIGGDEKDLVVLGPCPGEEGDWLVSGPLEPTALVQDPARTERMLHNASEVRLGEITWAGHLDGSGSLVGTGTLAGLPGEVHLVLRTHDEPAEYGDTVHKVQTLEIFIGGEPVALSDYRWGFVESMRWLRDPQTGTYLGLLQTHWTKHPSRAQVLVEVDPDSRRVTHRVVQTYGVGC